MKRHTRISGGFTLVETMMALAVLLAAIVMTTGFLGHIRRAGVLTERVTVASSLAQDKLEALEQQKFSALAGGADTLSPFQRAWSVSNSGSLKMIAVTVTWTDVDNRTHRVLMQTARAP